MCAKLKRGRSKVKNTDADTAEVFCDDESIEQEVSEKPEKVSKKSNLQNASKQNKIKKSSKNVKSKGKAKKKFRFDVERDLIILDTEESKVPELIETSSKFKGSTADLLKDRKEMLNSLDKDSIEMLREVQNKSLLAEYHTGKSETKLKRFFDHRFAKAPSNISLAKQFKQHLAINAEKSELSGEQLVEFAHAFLNALNSNEQDDARDCAELIALLLQDLHKITGRNPLEVVRHLSAFPELTLQSLLRKVFAGNGLPLKKTENKD